MTYEELLQMLREFFASEEGKKWMDAMGEAAGWDREKFYAGLGLDEDQLQFSYDQLESQSDLAYDRLEEEKRQFQASMRFKNKELELRRDEMAVREGEAAAERWYKEQQVGLALMGHQLNERRFGLDYWKTQADMRESPDDWLKLTTVTGGMQANPTGMAGFGAESGSPVPQGGMFFNAQGATPSASTRSNVVGAAPQGAPATPQAAQAAAAGVVDPRIARTPEEALAIATSTPGAAAPDVMMAAAQAAASRLGETITGGGPGRGGPGFQPGRQTGPMNPQNPYAEILGRDVGVGSAMGGGRGNGRGGGLGGRGGGRGKRPIPGVPPVNPFDPTGADYGAGAAGSAAGPVSMMNAFRATEAEAGLSAPQRQYVGTARAEAARGLHRMAPGTLERMDPAARAMREAAWARTGRDPGLLRRQYLRSRPGQGNALRA